MQLAMNRLMQGGLLFIVVGGVILFIGMFPTAIDNNAAIGIGLAQILTALTGLALIVTGAFTATHALLRRRQSPHKNLLRSIGVRLGMTGLVGSAASALADVLGFGTHSAGTLFLGWLQVVGILIGFCVAMLGVLLYAWASA